MKRSYVQGGNGEKTNLYLAPEIKQMGKQIAQKRYGISLSALVERLINAEGKRKRGVAHLQEAV